MIEPKRLYIHIQIPGYLKMIDGCDLSMINRVSVISSGGLRQSLISLALEIPGHKAMGNC